ncbi:helix-turn-helix domain-containing protein [Rhizobium sp. 16-449-1b]|uniref:TetR/AcrR family transcriptional regulator n=1 Tax=Rhizobium sp. 16-449-1b TaxID=2819989 RepID=UPI0032AF6079
MSSSENSQSVEDKANRRLARQQRRRERSREEILDAARKVLLRSGIAAMTLEAVAREAGISKTGLYYYFNSKDALVFELVFSKLEGHAQAVEAAVAKAERGVDALAAIVRETVHAYTPQMDDFRLAFMFGQVAGPAGVQWSPEQFARIRPLNTMIFGRAAALIEKDQTGTETVEPRLTAFLAYLAALGLLTMKGMVEAQGDPLIYSDEKLIEGFVHLFADLDRR